MAIQKVKGLPQEQSGPVSSIGGRTFNQASAAQANYAKRFAAYRGAARKFSATNTQQFASDPDTRFRQGNQQLQEFYRKFFADLQKNMGQDKQRLESSKSTGLKQMSDNYAARGISLSSGIVKQSQSELQNNINTRLRTAEAAMRKQREKALKEKGDKEHVLTKEHAKGLTEAANRRALQRLGKRKSGVVGVGQIG